MRLKEIETLLFIDPGASVPVILSNENKVTLLYYYYKIIENGAIFPKERNIMEDEGVATLTFNGAIIYKSGYPNDEVIASHPYYPFGLSLYKMFEVINSDWVDAIEKMNRIHRLHNPERFKSLKHYIITFKDLTFECIAKSVEISFTQKTMNEVLNDICVAV